MPDLYIITGSNGAGKSSVGPEYLPVHLRSTVFDGDKLFVNKRNEIWNSGIRSPKECSRIAMEYVQTTFDNLVNDHIHEECDFAYEGHFTNDATWDVPLRFKQRGFHIHLIFFGLSGTTLSETRVLARSKEGGHYVDPQTIANNYFGNLEKLDVHFEMFDSVQIIDTSGFEHIALAVLNNGVCFSAMEAFSLPPWFSTYLPNIHKRINNYLEQF